MDEKMLTNSGRLIIFNLTNQKFRNVLTIIVSCSFSMFSSPPPYADLIFQDAAQQLQIVPSEKRYYSTYLGNDYMRARRIVDCHAAGSHIQISVALLFLCLSSIVYHFRA